MTGHTWLFDGQAIYGEWLYDGDCREPIVLLHEGLGCVAMWQRGDFVESLGRATGRALFAYDRPGYGRSQPRRDPCDADFLETEIDCWLGRVLDAAGIDRPVLYGHSDGATIALGYAAANPDRVAGVIAEAPHVVVEDLTLDGIRAARAAHAEPNSVLERGLGRYHGAATRNVFDNWSTAWLDAAFAGADIEASLADIRVPVLAIQGDADPYGSAVHVDRIVELSGGPVRRELLSEIEHAPHREWPGFVDCVADFLNDMLKCEAC